MNPVQGPKELHSSGKVYCPITSRQETKPNLEKEESVELTRKKKKKKRTKHPGYSNLVK